jgi:manganese/iron transport system substrate-binding protein
MNLELWFEKFFENLSDVPGILITEGIVPMSIGDGPYNGKPNPHAWMSPENGIIYVENIVAALAKYDPENADFYRTNADAYIAEIRQISAPIQAQIDLIEPSRRWLVTSEGAFSYLARDFGLKELFIWPINADQQGTPQQVRKVIDTIREFNIPAVFSESTVSANPAKTIANETDAIYGGVLYVDSLSKADGPVPTYLDLIRVTIETIAKGLKP